MKEQLRRPLTAAIALAALLGLGGCVLTSDLPQPLRTSTPTGEAVSPEIEPYYRQSLVWEACDPGMQCSTAIAPLDWNDPAGDRIELALVRHMATGPRLGSLLVNPGGPGGSGYDFVKDSFTRAVSERLAARYDVVGFDPRGVGRSSAVSCTDSDAERDRIFFGIISGEEGSDEWFDAVRAETADWAQGCLEHTGPLLGTVDTGQAARDLDMLRAALGDERLNYLGYSYGTFLGASHAELFPERVGRFVLDGALDPSISLEEMGLGQAVGFEAAYRAWLADCLPQADCPFRGSVEDALLRTERIFDRLAASPLRHRDGRLLGADAMFLAVIVPLYDPVSWGYLSELFTEVEQGQTEIAFLLVDSLVGRGPDGVYTSNQNEASLAINCLDLPAVTDPEGMRDWAVRLQEAAPLFGPLMAWDGLGCADWPVPVTGQRHPITAPGSPDILVVGTTGDPATPYAWSEALANQLERGHLVSYRGEGHTAYNRASLCVDDAVDDFFLEGTLPPEGTVC